MPSPRRGPRACSATSLLGEGPAFDVEIVSGEGSYVCGEETALLNALEGRRPEVRARPPYPAERGLFGRPTLVNNVETLASLPWILRHGGAAYAAMGTAESRGTKLVSLNSLFRRPGLYEVELGVTVGEIVERLGGGVADGDIRGVLIGGPLAGVLPRERFDTPLDFEALRELGCEIGHGGIVAVDEHTRSPTSCITSSGSVRTSPAGSARHAVRAPRGSSTASTLRSGRSPPREPRASGATSCRPSPRPACAATARAWPRSRGA